MPNVAAGGFRRGADCCADDRPLARGDCDSVRKLRLRSDRERVGVCPECGTPVAELRRGVSQSRRFVGYDRLLLGELNGSNVVLSTYFWRPNLSRPAAQCGRTVRRGNSGGGPVSDRSSFAGLLSPVFAHRSGSAGAGVSPVESAGGIGGLLGCLDTQGTGTTADDATYAFFYDANGNVGQLADLSADPNDPAGALAAAYEYDAYGNVIATTGDSADNNPFRFSTKYWDDETGLGYWGQRYYEPDWGRWTNRDPIGEVSGDNLYAFVSNVPSAKSDPLGLQDGAGSGGAGGGAGAISVLARLREAAMRAIERLRNIDCADIHFAFSVAEGAVRAYEEMIETLGSSDVTAHGLRQALDVARAAADARCASKPKAETCPPPKQGTKGVTWRRCRPCDPPVGTLMYEVHRVPPSQPHWPHKGTHTHYYTVAQLPESKACVCGLHPLPFTLDGDKPSGIPLRRPTGGGIRP